MDAGQICLGPASALLSDSGGVMALYIVAERHRDEWLIVPLGMHVVMILAPFPLVFCLIWNRNMVLARNLKEAAEINSFLSRKMSAEGDGNSPEKKEGDTGRLVFSGGTKDVLEVSDCDFLYAEAEGNYVRVVFAAAGDGKPVRKLLRITMKQAEETVARCPLIIRCHRAFLVNVQKVVEVYGNSQGCRLRLGGCREEVPVSRACVKQVKALIEDRV